MGESQSLRSLEQILHAFGKAAAQFSTTRLRVVAFRDAARDDGLVTVPAALIPKTENGQPVIGKLEIGGTGQTSIRHRETFYGIGGAIIRANEADVNVGFVLNGPSTDDEAVASFRELGSEAGVIAHINDLVPAIQRYDNPLVVWVAIVYASLQGSTWLSAIDLIPKMSALHFSPFAASVETLKRLSNGRRSDDRDELIQRLLAGPDEVELSPREVALLEAYLRRPVSFATIQQERKATDHSQTEAAWNKLALICDFNRRFQRQSNANEPEKPSDPAPSVVKVEATTAAAPDSNASLALMRVFTNGIIDDRIEQASRLLADDNLTANEKLTQIDALIPFPATASAEDLGDLLGVTRQSIMRTEWWAQNRKGEKKSEVGRRRERHKERSESYESCGNDDCDIG